MWNSGVKGEVQTKEKEFLQKFAAVSLVELPISVETKGETTAEKGVLALLLCPVTYLQELISVNVHTCIHHGQILLDCVVYAYNSNQ